MAATPIHMTIVHLYKIQPYDENYAQGTSVL